MVSYKFYLICWKINRWDRFPTLFEIIVSLNIKTINKFMMSQLISAFITHLVFFNILFVVIYNYKWSARVMNNSFHCRTTKLLEASYWFDYIYFVFMMRRWYHTVNSTEMRITIQMFLMYERGLCTFQFPWTDVAISNDLIDLFVT